MTSVTGSRITTDQVSRADEVCSTFFFALGSVADRLAERASTGTIALDRAPPMASSTMRFGTWLAVTYAVPRQPAPTLFANTTVRTRPRTRESAVSAATMKAPRAIPLATLSCPPRSRLSRSQAAMGRRGPPCRLAQLLALSTW